MKRRQQLLVVAPMMTLMAVMVGAVAIGVATQSSDVPDRGWFSYSALGPFGAQTNSPGTVSARALTTTLLVRMFRTMPSTAFRGDVSSGGGYVSADLADPPSVPGDPGFCGVDVDPAHNRITLFTRAVGGGPDQAVIDRIGDYRPGQRLDVSLFFAPHSLAAIVGAQRAVAARGDAELARVTRSSPLRIVRVDRGERCDAVVVSVTRTDGMRPSPRVLGSAGKAAAESAMERLTGGIPVVVLAVGAVPTASP